MATTPDQNELCEVTIRPLRRTGTPGVWLSRDGRYSFYRHESDPQPKRWFIYDESRASEKLSIRRMGVEPINEGSGITSLRDAVAWAEDDATALSDPGGSDARDQRRRRAFGCPICGVQITAAHYKRHVNAHERRGVPTATVNAAWRAFVAFNETRTATHENPSEVRPQR